LSIHPKEVENRKKPLQKIIEAQLSGVQITFDL